MISPVVLSTKNYRPNHPFGEIVIDEIDDEAAVANKLAYSQGRAAELGLLCACVVGDIVGGSHSEGEGGDGGHNDADDAQCDHQFDEREGSLSMF